MRRCGGRNRRGWGSSPGGRGGNCQKGRRRARRRKWRGHRGKDTAPTDRPASPPPITITLFKDILFHVAAEARLGNEHHFFGFGKTNAFAEDGEVQQLDAAEEGAISMNEKPKSAAAVGINETEQS